MLIVSSEPRTTSSCATGCVPRSGSGRRGSPRRGSPRRGPTAAPPPPPPDPDREMRDYYAARAPEYDDWYLRRGRYSRGPARDLAWHAELDQATAWLDRVPFAGELVELAAGTGWWSPLLAQKGELSMYDANPGPLEIARERLVAHHLRAHLHVRDAWAEPDREVDGLFCGFWLSHVAEARLSAFLDLVTPLAAPRWTAGVHRFAARPRIGCGRSRSGRRRRHITAASRRWSRVPHRQGPSIGDGDDQRIGRGWLRGRARGGDGPVLRDGDRGQASVKSILRAGASQVTW